MKFARQIIIAFVSIGIAAVCIAQAASASSASIASASPNPFQGTFTGTAVGDSDSSATLALDLMQNGTNLAGTATIGKGLMVETGGLSPDLIPVPAGIIPVTGSASAMNPNHFEADSSLIASGLTITGKVIADLSKDGKTMDLDLNLEIPWPYHSTKINAKVTRS